MIAPSRFAISDLLAASRVFSKHKLKVSNTRNKSKKSRSLGGLQSSNGGLIWKSKQIRFRQSLKKSKSWNKLMRFLIHLKMEIRKRKSPKFQSTYTSKSLVLWPSTWLLAGIGRQRSFSSTIITVTASTSGRLAVSLPSCLAWWRRTLTTLRIEGPCSLAKATTSSRQWMEDQNKCRENSCSKPTSLALFSK